MDSAGKGIILNMVVRESLPEKLTFSKDQKEVMEGDM